jgi:hypothetical protein
LFFFGSRRFSGLFSIPRVSLLCTLPGLPSGPLGGDLLFALLWGRHRGIVTLVVDKKNTASVIDIPKPKQKRVKHTIFVALRTATGSSFWTQTSSSTTSDLGAPMWEPSVVR